MLLLNFAHSLTAAQLGAAARLANRPVERVLDLASHFDPQLPFADQVRDLADRAGLAPEQWQGTPLLVNLPSLSAIAGPLLAELHGRMGYFPTVLRLRPVAGSLPPEFEVAEILNLQSLRDRARQRR